MLRTEGRPKSAQNVPILLASTLAVMFLGVFSKDLGLSSIFIVWISLFYLQNFEFFSQLCSCFILPFCKNYFLFLADVVFFLVSLRYILKSTLKRY